MFFSSLTRSKTQIVCVMWGFHRPSAHVVYLLSTKKQGHATLSCSVEVLIRSSFLLLLFLFWLKKPRGGWTKYRWDLHFLHQLSVKWLTGSKAFWDNWHLDMQKLGKLSGFIGKQEWFIPGTRRRVWKLYVPFSTPTFTHALCE